jgi:hypothetical protein
MKSNFILDSSALSDVHDRENDDHMDYPVIRHLFIDSGKHSRSETVFQIKTQIKQRLLNDSLLIISEVETLKRGKYLDEME